VTRPDRVRHTTSPQFIQHSDLPAELAGITARQRVGHRVQDWPQVVDIGAAREDPAAILGVEEPVVGLAEYAGVGIQRLTGRARPEPSALQICDRGTASRPEPGRARTGWSRRRSLAARTRAGDLRAIALLVLAMADMLARDAGTAEDSPGPGYSAPSPSARVPSRRSGAASPRRGRIDRRMLERRHGADQLVPKIFRGGPDLWVKIAVYNPVGAEYCIRAAQPYLNSSMKTPRRRLPQDRLEHVQET
jgi:hypothetical protein